MFNGKSKFIKQYHDCIKERLEIIVMQELGVHTSQIWEQLLSRELNFQAKKKKKIKKIYI